MTNWPKYFRQSKVLVGLAFCSCGIFLGAFGVAAKPSGNTTAPGKAERPRSSLTNIDAMTAQSSAELLVPPSSQVWFEGTDSPFSKIVAAKNTAKPTPVKQQPSTRETTSLAQGPWSIVDTPQAKGALTKNFLGGATCVSQSDCWVVGYSNAELLSGLNQTLIEHWDGSSWRIVDSPNTDPTLTNNLFGVACSSTSDCWAVGGSITPTRDGVVTLIEHWDGRTWTIVASPNPPGGNFNALNSVTCISPTQCWAVGFGYVGSVFQTLVEKWDGNSWTVVGSPNSDSIYDNVLNSVICNASNNCWAVGGSGTSSGFQTLTEHWDGTSWNIVTSANMEGTQGSVLYSISCSTPSQCWGVGEYAVSVGGVGAGVTLARQNLIEQWDGTSWSVTSSAPLPLQYNFFTSVTCPSASDCWTVGLTWPQESETSQAAPTSLIEHWNGVAWTLVVPPSTSATGGSEEDLYAVACASGSDCWAIGAGYESVFGILYQQTLTDHWDGTSWNVVASPNRAPIEAHNDLNGVTCLSPTQCWAVGSYIGDGLIEQTVTKYWNGGTWTIVPSADASLPAYSYLSAVTCISASDCWSVGGFGPGNPNTLTEHWDGGSWTIVSSPDIPVSNPTDVNNGNFLNGVACNSTSDCWTVGYGYASALVAQTLVEHWNGTGWSIVTSPSPSAQHNEFNGLVCNSTSDCWAVGIYNDVNGTILTLTEHWDGVSWSVVNSPNVDGAFENTLYAVSCVGSSDCWAIGTYDISTAHQTLIEHWDGTSWTIVSSPNTGPANDTFLTGISCTGSANCWAVGLSNDLIVNTTLVEHWDGTAWTIVSSPNTSTGSDYLKAVTCASDADCVAVGGFDNGIGEFQGLVEHYLAGPPILNSVVSRKTHGNAGTFDVDLTTGNGIECRSDGANGSYTIVFSFANPLTSVDGASITAGTGSVASANIDGTDSHNYIVTLTGVTNAQSITVTLSNVADSAGNLGSAVSGSMKVLVGDTNGDGFVNSADISQTKSQSGQPVTGSNFREDLNADGFVNSADISLVKSKSGTALPQ